MATIRNQPTINRTKLLLVLLVVLAASYQKIMDNFYTVLDTLLPFAFIGAFLASSYLVVRLLLFKKKAAEPVEDPIEPATLKPSPTSKEQKSAVFFGVDMLTAESEVDEPVEEELLLEPIDWDESTLSSITLKQFREVCIEYFKLEDYAIRQSDSETEDADSIMLYKQSNISKNKPDIMVQLKAWNTYNVGVNPIKDQYNLMTVEQIQQGMLITTGNFTAEAREFASWTKLDLISGAIFLDWIKRLPEDKQEYLLEIALKKDATQEDESKSKPEEEFIEIPI